MKTKILLSSIFTMAVCLCLIAGSTFALFTSKVETSIAVTAGNVDVKAVINTVPENFTGLSAGDTQTRVSVNEGGTPTLEFANGGTATLTQEKLVIQYVTPGDSVTFYIDVTDTSNVSVKYQIEMAKAAGATSSTLTSKLKFYVEALQEDGSYTAKEEFSFNEQSEWYSFPEGKTKVEKAFRVTVEFPTNLTEEEFKQLQEATSNDVKFIVTAVQANGV